MPKKKITIYDYISSYSAISPTQGETVFNEIMPTIKNCIETDTDFSIDFTNINTLTTAFLNNAIGKLFYIFDSTSLLKRMSFTGFSNTTQITTLKLTLSNSLALSKSNN